MTRLQTQHQRLFLNRETPTLVGSDGRVRAIVLGLAQSADWALLSAVWSGVQLDLELPEPGIAVDGGEAFALWFSLIEPVPQAEAAAFLTGLCRRYLPGVKPGRLRLWPALPGQPVAQTPVDLMGTLYNDSKIDAQSQSRSDPKNNLKTEAAPPRIPPQQTRVDRWSAFVAPDLAAVFADDPALDMLPGDDAQADLLSRLVSISPAAFEAARVQLLPAQAGGGVAQDSVPTGLASAAAQGAEPFEAHAAAHGLLASQAVLAGPFQDPRQFLLAVMNEATVPLAQRIEAAKALLPHTLDSRG